MIVPKLCARCASTPCLKTDMIHFNPIARKIVTLERRFLQVLLVACTVIACVASCSDLRAQAISRPFAPKFSSRDTSHALALPQLPTELPGLHGALHLDSNGHIISNDGTRLRFFGTSLTYTAQFLTSADAKALAARLHKLGFNAVKFVYNDAFGYDDASFFKGKDSTGAASGSSYLVNPAQVAKFDTLLFELKNNGIYAFMMLNSTHTFAKKEGIPHPDSSYSNSYLFEILDAGAAALERKWARTFLGHVNPLTGLRLADDPQLAVIELVQEQSLYYYWSLGRLNYIDDADRINRGQQTVTYLQSKFLDSAYNLFLKHKYGSDQGVVNGWIGTSPVSGKNLMDDGSFENPASAAWTFAARDGAVAFKVDADGGVDSSVYEKIRITSIASNASPGSITYTNLSSRLGKDSLYELSFWAKMAYNPASPAALTRNISIVINNYSNGTRSLNTTMLIDTTWKKYAITFRSLSTGLHSVQLQFGAALGDVWIDAVSLHHKTETGLLPGESLANSSVQRLLYKSLSLVPLQRVRDQVLFLDSLEQGFFRTMESVIKDTMQFKGLVNFTQNNYWYSLPDIYAASSGDVAEYHSGWDYLSSRPGKSYTDSTWMVRNTAMVKSKSAGTLGSIASNSRAGKGFVLGEYTMPWPNQYISEQVVLLSAFAAYQDWDGLFITPFGYYRDDLFADSLRNPFHTSTNVSSIANNPAVLSGIPTASKLFREALVMPAGVTAFLRHDQSDLWLAPIDGNRGSYWVDGPFDNNVATTIGIRQHFGDSLHYVAAQYPYLADTLPKHTDTGELVWDETNGLFTLDASQVEGGAGFFGGDTLRLKQLELSRQDNARDMLSFMLVALDSLPIERSSRQLLTLSTRAQNSGLAWTDSLGFGKNWGTAPVIMSAATVTLLLKTSFDSTFLQPLDGSGKATGTATPFLKINDTTSSIQIDQQQTPSVWFEIVQRNGSAGIRPSIAGNAHRLRLSTNPARESTIAHYSGVAGEHVHLSLIDDLGRLVDRYDAVVASSGIVDWRLDIARVPSGHYLVRAASAGGFSLAQLSVVK